MEPLPHHNEFRRAMLRDEIRLIDETTRRPRPRVEKAERQRFHVLAAALRWRGARVSAVRDLPEGRPEAAA